MRPSAGLRWRVFPRAGIFFLDSEGCGVRGFDGVSVVWLSSGAALKLLGCRHRDVDGFVRISRVDK